MNILISWLVESSEDFQLYLFFGLLFTLIATEQLIPFRKISFLKRWKANFILTILSIITLFIIPVTFISTANLAEANRWGLFNLVELNWLLVGIISVLLRGFISFFTHYLMHRLPLFWRVHRVHHLDTEMDVSTTVRFHPFEFLINSLVGIPIIILFGFPVWSLMLYELLDVIITLFSHSNITLPVFIEKWLRYLVVTPDLHRVHHSSHQPETDSNFSAVFPVWDIIFGTFRTKTSTEQDLMELGLKEVRDHRTTDIGWLLRSPFKPLDFNVRKNSLSHTEIRNHERQD